MIESSNVLDSSREDYHVTILPLNGVMKNVKMAQWEMCEGKTMISIEKSVFFVILWSG
jgi:hypothetical protein